MESAEARCGRGGDEGQAGPMAGPMAGPFDTIRFYRSDSLRRWTADERRTKRQAPEGRAAPLVVAGGEDYGDVGYGDVSEREADSARMGCNMESDLGDFLRWEAEYVGGVI